MSVSFVTYWKRTLNESRVIIKLLNEIIAEATSDLEMSKEQSRFRKYLRQSFWLERSISSRRPFREVLKVFKRKSNLDFAEIKTRDGQ